MKILVQFLGALSIVGCAAPAADAPKSAALQCTRETPTGSNLPVTRCRSVEDMAREKGSVETADDALGRSRSMYRGPVPGQ